MCKRLMLVAVIAASMSMVTGASRLSAQDKLYDNTFSLSDVELLDGPFRHAMDLNVQVLLEYDTDRLLAPFLHEAGLPKKAEYFPNWEGLDGHVGGHYISALAIHYAAAGSQECYDRLKYVLSELKRCQDANGNGYVGGVPNGTEIWREVSKGNFGPLHGAWVPWYNVHKTFAGLRDAWQYAGIEEAREMFIKFCDWAVDLTKDLTDGQMDQMVSQEFGGMDEVLADAYAITGDKKYMTTAKRFAHHLILDSMADGIDNLDNKHANTQVPKVVGYARIADLDGDATFKTAAEFFWDRVANHRSVVIGGNSRSEHFPAAADYKSYVEHREGPESCNTNNMLKLTQFLFKMDQKAEYADFYERALYNHILSTQHPEHGGYVYFTSMRPGHYRVYSQPNSGMWCCVGTGMENHGKYGEFIYTHNGSEELYVNLFIASKLNWKENKATLTQETQFPYAESSRITVDLKKSRKFKVMVRCPQWISEGEFSVKVGGVEYAEGARPSSYVAIDRKWKKGDVIEISLPMHNTIEPLQNEEEYIAVLHGPIVMAARTSQEHLDGLISDDGRWAHIASGPLTPLAETPIMIGGKSEIANKLQTMRPVAGKPLNYTADGLFDDSKFGNLVFEPFFSLHDSRYAVYFLSLSNSDYNAMLDKIKADEQAMLLLDRRTIDKVTPAEQQPEVDHRMRQENSMGGNQDNKPYRTVRRGGSFSYELATGGKDGITLCIGYWDNEESRMPRAMEITIDGETFVTEKEFPATKENKIVRKEYKIPSELVSGKEYIRVGFHAAADAMAARVFDVRLLD